MSKRTLSTVVSMTVDLVAVAGATALPLGPPTIPYSRPCWDDDATSPDGAEEAVEATATSLRRRSGGGSSRDPAAGAAWTAGVAQPRSTRSAIGLLAVLCALARAREAGRLRAAACVRCWCRCDAPASARAGSLGLGVVRVERATI